MMEDPKPPRVSVGLPVYNGEKYLRVTLDAILGQTFADLEVIVCDNASSDGTEQICREYAERDVRVRYYRNRRNLGASKNFNRSFELGRGEYFKWSAVDDLIAPNTIERCVDALDQHPGSVLAYTLAEQIDALGQVRSTNGVLETMEWRPGAVNRFKQLLDRFSKDQGVSGPMFLFGLFRRSALERIRPMGGFFASDLVLLSELALEGEFVEVPERLLSIRMHPGASSWPDTWSYESIMEFYDPEVRGRARRTFQMQRYYLEYFAAVARSPLKLYEKAALFVYCTKPPVRKVRHKLRELRGGDSRAEEEFRQT